MTDKKLTSAVLRVGHGRGFVVERRDDLGHTDRLVLTAAHCLPHLPPAHPASYTEERTFANLLGPLGSKPNVWAECLFVDPVADVAVLCAPDGQPLYDEAEAFETLVEAAHALPIADAPAQRMGSITIGGGTITVQADGEPARKVKSKRSIMSVRKPGVGRVRVLTLDAGWQKDQIQRRGHWLSFEPDKLIESGMSGSPILSPSGAAIGLVSVTGMNPVLVETLPARFVRAIQAASGPPNPRKRTKRRSGQDVESMR